MSQSRKRQRIDESQSNDTNIDTNNVSDGSNKNITNIQSPSNDKAMLNSIPPIKKSTAMSKRRIDESTVKQKHSSTSDSGLHGFTALPILLYPDDHTHDDTKHQLRDVYRYLYYKQHRPKEVNTSNYNNSSSTLLIINIPPHYTTIDLQSIFNLFGNVNDCYMIVDGDLSTSIMMKSSVTSLYPSLIAMKMTDNTKVYNRHALLTFDSIESMNTALSVHPIHNPIVIPYTSGSAILNSNEISSSTTTAASTTQYGLPSYIAQYHSQRPDVNELESSINKLMLLFDKQRDTERQHLNEISNTVDDDGFTLVTYKNKNRNNLHHKRTIRPMNPTDQPIQARVIHKRLHGEAARKKNRKLRDNNIFMYSHQHKESKKKKIHELRQKFQEDKKKIESFKKRKALS